MAQPQRITIDPQAVFSAGGEELYLLEAPYPRLCLNIQRRRDLIPADLAASIAGACVGGPWPLVITGPAGTGKTCAALCLADRVRPRPVPDHPGSTINTRVGPVCWKLSDLASHLSEIRNGKDIGENFAQIITPQTVWDQWEKVPLAIIDEVNSPPSHDGLRGWHMEVVLKCLDSRYGRPTVVLSNHPIAEIAKLYDDRIASRMSAGTVFAFNDEATDQRMGQGTLALG